MATFNYHDLFNRADAWEAPDPDYVYALVPAVGHQIGLTQDRGTALPKCSLLIQYSTTSRMGSGIVRVCACNDCQFIIVVRMRGSSSLLRARRYNL